MGPDYLVDAGNTTCKVVATPAGVLGTIFRYDLNSLPRELTLPGLWVVLAGSNLEVLNQWQIEIQGWGSKAQLLTRDKIPILKAMEDPSTVGVDRLLVCLGAQVLHGKGPHLVVDSGTAITANLLGDDGHFYGGAIGPGFGLMNRALADKTSALFEVDLHKPFAKFPASTTRDAIRLGVQMAAVGFVRQAWEWAREKFPNCPLHLTGRDAPLLHTNFPSANLNEQLLFHGVLATLHTPLGTP